MEILNDNFLTGYNMESTTHKYKIELNLEIDFKFWTTPVLAWNQHSRTLEINFLFIGIYIDFVKQE